MRVGRSRLLLIGLGAIICALALPLSFVEAEGDAPQNTVAGGAIPQTTCIGIFIRRTTGMQRLALHRLLPAPALAAPARSPTPTPTPLPTSISIGGQTLYRDSYIRDAHLGQTYRLTSIRSDLGFVRQWIAPTDPAIYRH